jgi:hypothetical protein
MGRCSEWRSAPVCSRRWIRRVPSRGPRDSVSAESGIGRNRDPRSVRSQQRHRGFVAAYPRSRASLANSGAGPVCSSSSECSLTIVAADSRSADCSLRSLSFDSAAAELARQVAHELLVGESGHDEATSRCCKHRIALGNRVGNRRGCARRVACAVRSTTFRQPVAVPRTVHVDRRDRARHMRSSCWRCLCSRAVPRRARSRGRNSFATPSSRLGRGRWCCRGRHHHSTSRYSRATGCGDRCRRN